MFYLVLIVDLLILFIELSNYNTYLIYLVNIQLIKTCFYLVLDFKTKNKAYLSYI